MKGVQCSAAVIREQPFSAPPFKDTASVGVYGGCAGLLLITRDLGKVPASIETIWKLAAEYQLVDLM